MISKRKKLLVTLMIFISITNVFGIEIPSIDVLLISYLENDADLKKNAIEVEKARLSFDSTKIENGFDIKLSTGNITIKTNTDGTSFNIKPNVQTVIPQASNLKVSASTSYTYENDSNKLENTQLLASVDLVSNHGLSRKLSLLKSERSLKEATRKLHNQTLLTEKSFYLELKDLLSSTSSLTTLEKNLYTNKIDFEKIKAQGYSENSSTYRLAQMKVISSEHEIESLQREIIYAYILFYKKCGFDIFPDLKDALRKDFIDYIPADIKTVEPVDIQNYKPELFTEIENALWVYEKNTMERKLNKNWTLSANGGMTFNNSVTSSDTIDGGITSDILGINVGAGVSLPINDLASPALTFSAALNPNTFRLNNINKQANELSEQEELININTAYTNYENKKVECIQNLEKILWNTKSDQESYEMYVELERELGIWYEQGIISESEYYTAKVNMQSFYVRMLINKIDLIIYNDNIVTMFVDE